MLTVHTHRCEYNIHIWHDMTRHSRNMFLIQSLRFPNTRKRCFQFLSCRYASPLTKMYIARGGSYSAGTGEAKEGALERKLARQDAFRRGPTYLKRKMYKQREESNFHQSDK
jgi:hypothetical protein